MCGFNMAEKDSKTPNTKRADNIVGAIETTNRKDTTTDVFTSGVVCKPAHKVLLIISDGKLEIAVGAIEEYKLYSNSFDNAALRSVSEGFYNDMNVLKRLIADRHVDVQFDPQSMYLAVTFDLMRRVVKFPLNPTVSTPEDRFKFISEEFRQYRLQMITKIKELESQLRRAHSAGMSGPTGYRRQNMEDDDILKGMRM